MGTKVTYQSCHHSHRTFASYPPAEVHPRYSGRRKMLAGQHWRLRQGRRGYRYPNPDNRGRRNIATWGNEDTVFFFSTVGCLAVGRVLKLVLKFLIFQSLNNIVSICSSRLSNKTSSPELNILLLVLFYRRM